MRPTDRPLSAVSAETVTPAATCALEAGECGTAPSRMGGGRSRHPGQGEAQASSSTCLSAPPAGSKPAASAASASANQNSALVWSYHCEPSTWYFPESALPLTV